MDFKNSLLPALAEEEEVKRRLAVCATCHHMKQGPNAITGQVLMRCGACGCFMTLKARFSTAMCPEKRW